MPERCLVQSKWLLEPLGPRISTLLAGLVVLIFALFNYRLKICLCERDNI